MKNKTKLVKPQWKNIKISGHGVDWDSVLSNIRNSHPDLAVVEMGRFGRPNKNVDLVGSEEG